MNPQEITDHLVSIASSDDFPGESAALVDEWSDAPDAFSAIGPVLLFIEQHPEVDFGTPGPLVHFVEGFYGRGYEQELIESVNRKPTVHTVWMTNRVINGTKNPEERRRLVEVLRQARDNPLADSDTRDVVTLLLDKQ